MFLGKAIALIFFRSSSFKPAKSGQRLRRSTDMAFHSTEFWPFFQEKKGPVVLFFEQWLAGLEIQVLL
jgi:hypothetical protein